MDVDYIRQVPVTKERYTYTKSRTTNIFDDILHDDVPSIVRNSYSKAVQDDIPIYTSQYTPTSPYRSATREDDISFKARPNTDYVVNRAYSQYGALPRWNDTLEVSTQFPELRRSPSPFKSPPTVYSETRPTTNTNYMPSYVPRSSLLIDHDHPKFDRFNPKWGLDSKSKPERSPRPYFLQPELPRFYPSGTKPEDASRRVSSRLNTEFPFRKYRSDFVPYAPYHNMYDSMKYCPNPDWVTMRPWGHRFRKARFVYVPEDKNSSTSIEIERVMREARMRELCKGIYSSNYGDDIRSSVNLATGLLDNTSSGGHSCSRRPDVKAAEAEIAPTQGEKERRKHRSLADKRKRNETLAVGLSRTELLKNDNESPSTASSKLTTSSIPPREVTRSKEPTPPPPKEPTPPQKGPTPPAKEPTPPPKETTPPQKGPTPPAKEPTPPPKEPTPPPKETTPPLKEPTPPPKEPTPPPKDPTPPPKDPTPPPKEPTPPPKELTPPPPKEPTPPPPKELTPPPPKEPTPPPPKEPTPPPKELTPPPPKEPTPPPPKEPTPPPPRELTPPCLRESTPPLPKEPTPPPNETSFPPLPTEKELTPPPQKETSPAPKVEVTTPNEEDIPTQETSPEEETDNIAESVEEYKEAKETATNPEMYDQLNGNMEDSIEQRTETGHYMVEEVDNGDGQIIRTEYMIEEIEFSK